MTAERRGGSGGHRGGAVSAGAWLVALGLVFLVKDLGKLSWGEAWPLFIIAVGVASLISSLLGYRAVATSALLSALAGEIDGRFDRYETSFVWDGNDASNGMGRYLGNQVLRRFAVWTQDLA